MDGLLDAWNPSWSKMPWKVWTNPWDRFQVLPSFVLGEFVFIFLSLLLLFHAAKQGRLHLTVWCLSFVTGFANDCIFMALPFVDNFWQSQASIMMTPRAPLYIPCVYNVFMYCGVVGSWRFRLPVLAEAALAGLMGEMIYSPYDITGAKFLWWTWHDTDAPIRHRILGVPVGSSAWVITFTGTFQLLIRLFILKNPKSITKGIIINVALTTLIMMVQMAFFQLISGDEQGLPSQKTLIAVISGYTLAVIVGFATKGQQRPSSNPFVSYPSFDNLPRLGLTLYFAFLALNMAFANPEAHLSTGVHQTIGPCDVMERDLAGQLRQVYLCPDTHTQDWTFDTTDNRPIKLGPDGEVIIGHPQAPPNYTEWYTIRSKPHSNFPLWLGVTTALCSLGMFWFRIAFGFPDPRRPARQKQE